MALPKLMQPPREFLFEEPEGRPFRIISVETELDGAAQALAQDLCSQGIVGYPDVQRYSWHPEPNHPHIAFLKFDGSVTGGELVFDKLDLTNPAHAAAMLRAHERLRGLEKNGDVQYNPNCGGHIHMDAAGFGFHDLIRLMTVFGFCEEPIFRLAGAGKTYGHRTLYAGYDRTNHGGGFADPISKGPFNTPKAAWQTMSTQKRMSGLNTNLYLAQVDANGASHGGKLCNGGCSGAMEFIAPKKNTYGETMTRGIYDKKTCTCPKKKNTIEWRVWNAQGNPRILYAWIALMQAMHAYSWVPVNELKAYKKVDPMPAFTWTWRPFSKLTEAEARLAQDRVQFMFSEFPLTSEEKDALRYAFMRTPYKVFGKEWMKTQADTPYKKPPYPNEYKKSFKRKLGLNPEGKTWGDDSHVDYTVSAGVDEEIPFDAPPIEGGRIRGQFPVPGLGGPVASDYSQTQLYQQYQIDHLRGWNIAEGVGMRAPDGSTWRYQEGVWNPGPNVGARRTVAPRFGNAIRAGTFETNNTGR